MDKVKAQALAKEVVGVEFDGWEIVKYINHGKSAAVFSAKKAGQLAAVKIFDTELIERYGDQTQLARIHREIELVGFSHENLVGIYGGGYNEKLNLFYIVMEFIEGENLKEFLPNLETSQIGDLVRQLSRAAFALEERGLVHRDIKPENIAICDGGKRLVLLDFGVIRQIKGSSLTDPDGLRAFIGTLQYSSPEFLLRNESQDVGGFRALTFYQIGAVLHDMIMGRPIFEKFAEPYAALVNAVQHEKPNIFNSAVDPHWISVADRCLLKNPATRVKILKWKDFEGAPDVAAISPKERVAEHMVTVRAKLEETGASPIKAPSFGIGTARALVSSMKVAAKTARSSVQGLPRLKTQGRPDGLPSVELIFEPDGARGFPYGLRVFVELEIIDELEGVIVCKGTAILSSTQDALPILQPWFEGVGDSVAVLQAFDKFLFESIEWCIHTSPSLSGEFCVQRPAVSKE